MHVHRFGVGRPRIVALHGFAQQGGHLAEVAPYLGAATVAPDLPGHGPDPHLPATMDEAVDRVVALLDDTGADVLLGYSMGGRVALRAAVARRVGLLVLVSSTAGIRDPAARGERAAADDELADRIEAEGLDRFLEEWDAKPMFAGRRARSEAWRERERTLRLRNTAAGVAAALRGMGQGATEPVPDEELAGLDIPTKLLVGSADAAYLAEAERMAGLIPDALVVARPDGGHALIDEDPGWVGMQVRRSR